MSELKSCKLCSEEVKQQDIEQFPLAYGQGSFEPKSNIVFCSKSCVKFFLIGKTYLLTLYSFYILIKFGIVALEATADPTSLACRQITPTKDSITLDQLHKRNTKYNHIDPKQCALCFLPYKGPGCTYITHKIHDIFQFANVGFCDRPCVNRYIGSLDPNLRELFDEYRRVVHHDDSGSFSRNTECLIQHQVIAQSDAMTFAEFHLKVLLPKPIHTEHYHSREILPQSTEKTHTVLQTVEEDELETVVAHMQE